MKSINVENIGANFRHQRHLFWGVIGFGIFLILWRIYYYWIGYPVRLWVTILWFGIASWLIGFSIKGIFWDSKIINTVLSISYGIYPEKVVVKNINNEIQNVFWKDIRVLILNKNNPKIIASGIFFVKDGKLYQIRVDADAGVDIAYHCLKWYLERGEVPKCVIVRDLGTAYKVLKQLVPKRLDPLAEIKPAKKIGEKRFSKYIRENFWMDKKAIEMELKRLEKEMYEESISKRGDA